jgi:hypothetical protein
MIIDISVQMHGPNSKFCNCTHKGKTALNNNSRTLVTIQGTQIRPHLGFYAVYNVVSYR